MARELSIEDAARHLGVSRMTIRQWMKEGKLEWRRVGKSRLVKIAEPVAGPVENGPVAVSAKETRGQNEMAIVVLRDRMERIEQERDLAIRRIGQLEQAYAQVSFWRRGMLWAVGGCLVLLVLLVGGWMWAWKEAAMRGVEAVRARQELAAARTDIERLAGSVNEAKSELSAAADEHKRQRSDQLARIGALEKDLASELQERVRLAQDLATAVSEAAAKEMLATTTASEARVQIEVLKNRLAMSQVRLQELEARAVPAAVHESGPLPPVQIPSPTTAPTTNPGEPAPPAS